MPCYWKEQEKEGQVMMMMMSTVFVCMPVSATTKVMMVMMRIDLMSDT